MGLQGYFDRICAGNDKISSCGVMRLPPVRGWTHRRPTTGAATVCSTPSITYRDAGFGCWCGVAPVL